MFDNLISYGKTHAPGILTATSILTGFVTTCYAFWAGGKVKEIRDTIPKDATWGYKAKKYVPVVAPIIVGYSVSALTCYSAHKVHTTRYLALAGTLALTQKDNENLRAMRNKMSEKLGLEKSEKARKEVAEVNAINTSGMLGVDRRQKIRLYDEIRGKMIETSMLAFWETVSKFNDNCENHVCTLVEFLEELAKANGSTYEFCEADENIIFGINTMTPIFNPIFDEKSARVLGNMSAVPVFNYRFSSPYEYEESKVKKKLYSDLGPIA